MAAIGRKNDDYKDVGEFSNDERPLLLQEFYHLFKRLGKVREFKMGRRYGVDFVKFTTREYRRDYFDGKYYWLFKDNTPKEEREAQAQQVMDLLRAAGEAE
jgi:hypothetical protein